MFMNRRDRKKKWRSEFNESIPPKPNQINLRKITKHEIDLVLGNLISTCKHINQRPITSDVNKCEDCGGYIYLK